MEFSSMSILENKNIKYLIVLLGFVAILGSNYFDKKSQRQLIGDYKEMLIQNDSLRRNSLGGATKIVDDRSTQKQINNIVKTINKPLHDRLTRQGKAPISVTRVQTKPLTKLDTLKVTNLDSTSHYYPQEKDYFIKFSSRRKGSILHTEWDLKPVTIDLVVSEKEKGIYEADLQGPEWLHVDKLEVNSIPLVAKEDNFDFMLGTSVGYRPEFRSMSLGIEAGLRYKKSIISTEVNSNSEVRLSYKRLF